MLLFGAVLLSTSVTRWVACLVELLVDELRGETRREREQGASDTHTPTRECTHHLPLVRTLCLFNTFSRMFCLYAGVWPSRVHVESLFSSSLRVGWSNEPLE